MAQPLIIVLAGPNGAGKSTAAAALLPTGMTFVNADEIAKGLPGYPSTASDIEAARLVLARLDELEEQRADFAIETTLSSRVLAVRIARLRRAGYFCRLIFIWAPSPDYSVQRVAARVRMGGHHIPEETIRRRYESGIKNFFELYRPLADSWEVHDNTRIEGFRMIAQGSLETSETIADPHLWGLMSRRGSHGAE